jgi:hypothetical protein
MESMMSDSGKALTRADLMREIDGSWNELTTYLDSLSAAQLTRPTDDEGSRHPHCDVGKRNARHD